jgi:hypothetical protein
MGRLGAGSWTIFSHRRQDFFTRAISMTFSWAAIMSSSVLTSSPTIRSSPPQSWQRSPGSRVRRSRGVASDTRGWRRGGLGAVDCSAPDASTGSVSSCGATEASAEATCRSSSASSSCSISRSIFSEVLPKACFFSLAIRTRSDWISRSWARSVTVICAFCA